jgi:hypothetical protein
MFQLKSKWLNINPEISRYIKEQTNKWLSHYINNIGLKLKTSDLVKSDYDSSLPNYYFLISFVSSISFLAGYKFNKLIN